MADDLRRGDALRQEGERRGRVVALLHLQRVPIDSAAIEPRRRSGLEPAHAQAEPIKALRQPERRGLVDPAGRDLALADMDQPVEEGAGGQHHGAGAMLRPSAVTMPADGAVIDDQVFDRGLDHFQVRRARGSPPASPAR